MNTRLHSMDGSSRWVQALTTLTVSMFLSASGCDVGDKLVGEFDYTAADVIPDGPDLEYYALVDESDATTLRETLHETIDDHWWYYYTHSSRTDMWDILEHAQTDPDDPDRVIDIYQNASFQKWTTGNTDYDREHTWPKSLGFPKNIKYNYPYTDGHHLMLANGDYNSERGNKPFGDCTGSCDEWSTLPNGDHGGSRDEDPETSNWTRGFNLNGVWDVWRGRRGDVARAMFYMDVRYEGGFHGVTDKMEPDLILTDDLDLIESDTRNNRTIGYMGHLSTLLQWHRDDPVSDEERHRHNVIATYQKNRNPFIDHPEWVECIFGDRCGTPQSTSTPWINELHYDNASVDADEGFEIAAAVGTDLNGWTVAAYNGSNGTLYKSVTLEGSIPGDRGGALWFEVPGLQNGSPDGLALIDANGEVVQRLSYEGVFTATDGPAAGLLFEAIEVSESATSPLGTSLQLIGEGCAYVDFTWSGSREQTPGSLNTAQAISCP